MKKLILLTSLLFSCGDPCEEVSDRQAWIKFNDGHIEYFYRVWPKESGSLTARDQPCSGTHHFGPNSYTEYYAGY